VTAVAQGATVGSQGSLKALSIPNGVNRAGARAMGARRFEDLVAWNHLRDAFNRKYLTPESLNN
jgi:hypothetical protein